METQVTQPQIVQQIVETQSQQVTRQIVNEEIPQARVMKNPKKIAAGRKGGLARKAKLMHYSNIEHSRQNKTWALVGVVAIAVVCLFYKTGKDKTSPPMSQQVQLEVSPHIML